MKWFDDVRYSHTIISDNVWPFSIRIRIEINVLIDVFYVRRSDVFFFHQTLLAFRYIRPLNVITTINIDNFHVRVTSNGNGSIEII